jgi:hypothetical protein
MSYEGSDSTVKLVWRKSKYASAFKEVLIKESDNVISTIAVPNDTTKAFKLANVVFGLPSNISLTINAKYPYDGYSPFRYSGVIANPTGAKRTFPNQRFYYCVDRSALVGYAAGKMRIYNASMQTVDSILMDDVNNVPYPSRFVYYRAPNENTVIRKSLVTGEILTQVIAGPSQSFLLQITGSDTGLFSYEQFDYSDPYGNHYYFGIRNIITGATIPFNGSLLSDDGRYSFNGYNVSQFDGSNFNNIALVPEPYSKFRPDNNDEIVSPNTPTNIYRSTDGTLLRTITPPGTGYTWLTYDPVTKNLLYVKDGTTTLYLINIETQAVKTINGVGVAFINGMLFDNNGNYIKLL